MSATSRPWSLAALVGLSCALGLTACSSSPSKSTDSTTTRATVNTHGGDAAPAAIGPIPAADLSPAGATGTPPTVTVPSGPPSTHLLSADLITGTGQTAEPGDQVEVQYVLATYSTHKVVSTSWTGQPFTFLLGEGQVIPGWDKGVPGMRVGGRRELIIPPSLGYQNHSPGPGIAANDTLVFVIDLLDVAQAP